MADKTQFHVFSAGGLTFKGVLSADGPYLHVFSGRNSLGGCALGFVCGISELGGANWLGKNGDHRVNLSSLSATELEALVDEFGLDRSDGFFTSPAASALAAWVHAHPRLAEAYSGTTSYLGDWHGRALQSNASPAM